MVQFFGKLTTSATSLIPIMWPLDVLNASYGHFFAKTFSKNLQFWAIMSSLAVWVIVKIKKEQQSTFAQIKIDWCVAQSWNFLSRVAMIVKIISSTNAEWWECYKFFSVLSNINCWFTKSFFLHSPGGYFEVLGENRKKWRPSSFFAI